LIISAGVFAGAVVSGFAGFAFSAVAGAVLLHVLPAIEAIPLMMACSIVTQGASLVALRRSVKWHGSIVLTAAGALGVVPALYLLHHVDTRTFRVGFGLFLTAYAAVMLLRPAMVYLRAAPRRLQQAIVGFGGGMVGGLTAMPGALPVIWCDLRGLSKDQQRGLVQPYITTMQVFALAMMLLQGGFSAKTMVDVTLTLPALVAGSTLGILMFGRVNEALFRQIVLAVLTVAGLALVI
jgi:uncharacterized membrane protein YfcA